MSLFSSNRKKPEPLDRETSLRGIPVLNEGVTSREREDGRLRVCVRIARKSGGVFVRFLPPVFERNVNLDELGSFVFRQIDGNKSTRDIIKAFVKEFRVNRREAELSCVHFLRSLAQRRVISIAIRK